jgi:purine nucleosidase
MLRSKIIIDTDIGDDIDDAFAIAFALNSPELELIGVTTVFKNTLKRAKLASQLLKLAGREDIPVFAGCSQPLANTVDEAETPCQYTDEFADAAVQPAHAVDYLIETLMASEGDITIVPIGALTNIATALAREPRIAGKIKEIVMMAGAYYSHCNEWNIVCDPEAARAVFTSGIAIKAVGLDVTMKVRLRPGDMDRIEHSSEPVSRYLANLMQRWRTFGNLPGMLPILHDPLAVFAVFDSRILTFSHEDVFVELGGEYTRGVTFLKNSVWGPKATGNTYVAKTVQKNLFLDLYMDRTFH